MRYTFSPLRYTFFPPSQNAKTPEMVFLPAGEYISYLGDPRPHAPPLSPDAIRLLVRFVGIVQHRQRYGRALDNVRIVGIVASTPNIHGKREIAEYLNV